MGIENLKDILWIISACTGILVTAISFLIPTVKNAKVKKALQVAVDMGDFVRQGCAEAYKFIHFTDEEKKAYVMTNAERYALENKVAFDKEKVSQQIDDFIVLVKKIYERKKAIEEARATEELD